MTQSPTETEETAQASQEEANINQSLTIERAKEVVQLVKSAHFFKEFSHEEIKKILKMSAVKYFKDRDLVVKTGDVAKSFYVILKGSVRVQLDGVSDDQCPLIVPGYVLGELALLERRQHRANCMAIGFEVVVLEISDQVFHDEHAPLPQKILHQIAIGLGKRVTASNELLKKVGASGNKRMSLKEQKEKAAAALHAVPEPATVASPPSVAAGEAEKKNESGDAKRVEEKKEAVAASEKGVEKEKVESKPKAPPNPMAVPTGTADEVVAMSQDEYDTLLKKLQMRIEFLGAKVPTALVDMVCARMAGYWSGAKLAKYNPHNVWNTSLFAEGKPRLLRAMHVVVIAAEGVEAYKAAYLDLGFVQKVVSYPQVGLVGTFLGCDEDIQRYFEGKSLKKAYPQDLELPIDRLWHGEESIEFLTHTLKDVRDETLFLVLDEMDGVYTRLVRKAFPNHQIVTSVYGTSFNPEEPASIFSQPEKELAEFGSIVAKNEYQDVGFYTGQTLFLSDFSVFYKEMEKMEHAGAIFGLLYTLARVGPDYSGVVWGSKGGAEGAVKAARAMFGIKGAQSASDIASAVNWADNG
jgi:CRP-like cAMP-binding protein